METAANLARCTRCGNVLPPDSPACPRCALLEALETVAGDSDTAFLSLHDIPQPGEKIARIGDHELLEVIAQGGMGVVYKARQKSLNRLVALKLLLGGAHASPDFQQRFRQEAQTAAKLQHPNIVPIYEIGEHERQPFFTMEFVAGPDLARRTREQSLPPTKTAEYVKTVAEAVQYAHEQGVLHRDLKPSNILVGPDDRPRVTDFGLARQIAADSSLTSSGATLGTPGYLPPEQASMKRGKVGPHSDIYSLGAVIYHLLTSRPPFLAGTIADTLQQVMDTEPVPPRRLNPTVPRDLETICLKCLDKDPVRRYSTAKGLAEDLGRFLRGEPILAQPISTVGRTTKWVRRNPLITSLGTGVVIALLAGTAASLRYAQAVRREAVISQRLVELLFDNIKLAADQVRDTQRLREILERTERQAAIDFADEPKRLAALYDKLGDAYLTMGELSAAERMFQNSLRLRPEKDGHASPKLGDSLHNQANVLREQGHFAQAEAKEREAIAAMLRSTETENATLATALNSLGLIQNDQGRFNQAERYLRESLARQQRRTDEGPDKDLNLAATASNLALALHSQGLLPEAEKIYRVALGYWEKPSVANNPNRTRTMASFAALLENQNKSDEAEGLLRQVIEIQQSPPKKPADLALSFNNLAVVLRHKKDLAQAEEAQRQAVALWKEAFPEGHPYIAQGLDNLGVTLSDEKKLADAEVVFREALVLSQKLKDPEAGIARTNLLKALRAQGKMKDAEILR
jgi:tetratricopeptide (TPR) repeat protein/tRNA A-37 threonylcarbamoyl transferase component Bud32